MNTEIKEKDVPLILLMAVVMAVLTVDATIRLMQLGRMIG